MRPAPRSARSTTSSRAANRSSAPRRSVARGSSTASYFPSTPAPDVELAAGVRAFFAGAAQTLVETDYADACPIATVALEVSSVDDELREACADVFNLWIEGGVARFTEAGIPLGRARPLVIQMIAALEGAFVLSRALRSTEPLEAAGEATAAAIAAEL